MSLDNITLAVEHFDLKKIAESGQCFRWKEIGPSKYLIPSGQTCAIMEQKDPDDLHELTGMETEQARTYLKSINGVGNKVADCVLLFGLHRVEAFPVDTWIRQVIDEHYGGKFPVEHYDGHAGIIQQFIFYYMQQHKKS